MELASRAAIPEPPIAVIGQLSENSRLGFGLRGSTLHQGPQPVKYLNGVRDSTSVAWNSWQMSLKAQEPQTQIVTPSTSTPSDPIVNALQKDVPGVATVTPTADMPFNKNGHKNETDALTFKSPEEQAKFVAEASGKGLLPGDVSKTGYGPGVRLDGGLHAESARLDPITGSVIVTSHIDRFNPNNGLGPMIGHAVVDVFIGSVFFRHSAGLD